MRFFRSKLFRLGVVVVSLVFIVTLSRSIFDLWQKRDMVRERQKELTRVSAENEGLKKKLSEADSPEFIEREARERLGLVKEGEAIVLIPKATAAGMLEEQSEIALPNWQQWLRLFF